MPNQLDFAIQYVEIFLFLMSHRISLARLTVSRRFSASSVRVVQSSILVDGVRSNDPSPSGRSSSSGDPIFVRLSSEISKLSVSLSPTDAQLEEKDAFLNRLQRTVKPIIDGAVVSPFGSAMNGFWSPNSDIDVCIRAPGYRTRTAQIQTLRRVAGILHPITSHFIEPRFGAKVPIIRWAPRRPGFLACDISINNSLAVINSRLVGTYCMVDPRMRTLGMVIKYWAQSRGINDRSRGTLSSFSLLLMLINFLQKRSPPILPSVQDLALELNEPLVYCDGVDVRFVSNMTAVLEELDRIAPVRNAEPTGYLLAEFFRFYGYEYKKGVIGIRDLRFFQSAERSGYLVVDNPFEVGKDVATVNSSQYGRIRQEFRRAHSLLLAGGLDQVCSRDQPPPPMTARRGASHPLDPPTESLGRTR